MFTKDTLAKAGAIAAMSTTLIGLASLNAAAATDPLGPVAVNDSFNLRQDHSLIIDAPGVLNNDITPAGGVSHVFRSSFARHGRLTMSFDGSFVYTPHPGFAGEDTITYQSSANGHQSNVASILFTITPTALSGRNPLVVVGE